MFPHHRRQGYHPTATCGTLGAAAAAGKALGLSREQMTWALGLASTQAAGLRMTSEIRGIGMMKRLHAGKAAQSGLLAAQLACKGFTAPSNILEGEGGFLSLHASQFDHAVIVESLGRSYQALNSYLKPHASCRNTHGPIDSVLALRQEHGLAPDDIKRVVVRIYREGYFLNDPNPRVYYDAQFSIPYVVALALVDGTVSLAGFTEAKLADPRIRRLCEKVEVLFDEKLDDEFKCTRSRPHTVEIELENGLVLSTSGRFPKGSPENPLTQDEVKAKFMLLARAAVGEGPAAQVVDLVRRIETLDRLDGLWELLSGKERVA
jgi:2-methylcitrate dehydratase PrpD